MLGPLLDLVLNAHGCAEKFMESALKASLTPHKVGDYANRVVFLPKAPHELSSASSFLRQDELQEKNVAH